MQTTTEVTSDVGRTAYDAIYGCESVLAQEAEAIEEADRRAAVPRQAGGPTLGPRPRVAAAALAPAAAGRGGRAEAIKAVAVDS